LAGAVLALSAHAEPRDGAQAKKGDAREVSAASLSLEDLERQLRDAKPEKRRAAVRGLVRLARPEAWRLVIEALADSDSGVADEAQLSIAGILDAKLWKELWGRAGLDSKDELVALRVAEALGNAKAAFDADEIAKLLGSHKGSLARCLVWSAERLARAGRLAGSVERLEAALTRLAASNSDLHVACAALVAAAELRTAHAKRLALDGLRATAPERRSASLMALVRMEAPEALASAIKLAADPEPRVRLQALDSLEALNTRAAMTVLVARLAQEPRLRLRWRIVDQLQAASGMKHRLDPRPWKLWIETLPAEGTLSRAPKPKVDPNAPSTRSGFTGLPLISDRVCYLFDFSGSMWTPLADGRIPKDLVSDKLRAALEALPADTEFNLIPFTNVPLPWSERALPASPKNLRAALEFFLACRERGKGNFLDAALLAASDPRIDTICVLTDGVPTGGTHSDMDLITPLFLEHTRFRRIVVDSILVDAPPAAARRWAELSRLTGGRSIEVELKPAVEGAK
jgi:HEAT repeat protein